MPMTRVGSWAAALVVGLSAGAAQAQNSDASRALTIPYDRFQLDNGLTVIFHHDKAQPLVVVNINVNVGSRDEKEKRTGFAHLFEHLMFMGTTRVPEKKFDAWMEAEGGWNNAWTSNDRTDYYDVGPNHTLPLLLWMEADRFSALGGQIDADKLETQRGVVRNERRQSVENTPYGVVELRMPELLFPEGHPYHHPVIGSHADLEAASVADVQGFFAENYVPGNISLVVAGDFDPRAVKPRVEQWFGSLPKTNLAERRKPPVTAALNGVVRETLEDNVTLAKTYIAYLSPAVYAPGDAELDLLSAIMTAGKASRLYKALVYDQKIAQNVSAYQASMSLRSHFNVEVTARPGVSLDDIEKAVDVVLEKLRTEKVTKAEINRAKNQYEASFVRRMQSLATRAALLNRYQAAHGDPDHAGQDLKRYTDATADDLLRVAKQVLDPNKRVILRVMPKKKKEGTP
jgi:zinc protease